MNKRRKLPKFKNDDQARKFWDTHSLADYAEAKDLKRVIFPNLKPNTRSISIRIPTWLINDVKVQANKLDIHYQALMKQYIAKGVSKN